uniref:DNA-directed RNA polymerase subunit alpha n=1 Tax=Edaphochlorella mirabilis TaxID=3083 RepID=A0A097KKS4_9CHLO|nr:alpha subunit of RNA polymerase [Edaphochlorella mirabilis]AIT93773.1 alpha subunit of RNA polymerase [Edaphochlorella mirabilis]
MEHLLLSCIESKIENNRSFYGRFTLGPFDAGQGLTIATALRRTLLSELTGLGIIAVEIKGATHEYSALNGIRESVLDILLNLKQIVLSSEISLEEPQIGFLKIQGPCVAKASDIKLPSFIHCVDPDQYIATLSYDGMLEIKFIICHGKNYIIQTPLTFLKPTALQEIYKNPSEKIQFLTQFFQDKQNHFKKQIYSKKKQDAIRQDLLEKKQIVKPQIDNNVAAIASYANDTIVSEFSNKQINQTNSKFLEFSNFTEANNFSVSTAGETDHVKEIEKQQINEIKKGQKRGTKSIFWKPKPHISIKSTSFSLETKKSTNILLLDTVFMPVNKVNFILENDAESHQIKERIILEIWTNGSIHPRQAINEAAIAIIQLFFPFQESRSIKSFFTTLSKTLTSPLLSDNWMSHRQFAAKLKTVNQNQKVKLLSQNKNLPIEKKRASIDIANLDLSLRPYTCLKRANINTVNDLLQNSADELLLLKNFGKRSLEEVENALAQINLKLRRQSVQPM